MIWGGADFPLSSGEMANYRFPVEFRSALSKPLLLLLSAPVHHLHMTMLASNYLTGSQAAALVASGDLTVEEVIKDHRKRIEERDKEVLAWTCTNFDVPKPSLTKELCGVTIGVKDIMSEP